MVDKVRIDSANDDASAKDWIHYYWHRLVGATVCRVRGHRQPDRMARWLGTCTRCWGDLPSAESRAFWDEVREAGEPE